MSAVICPGSFVILERPHTTLTARCAVCGDDAAVEPRSGYLRNVGDWSCRWVECVRVALHERHTAEDPVR